MVDGSGILIPTFQTAGSHQSGHSWGSLKGSKTQEAQKKGKLLVAKLMKQWPRKTLRRFVKWLKTRTVCSVWIDKKTVWLILWKKLKLHPYKQHDFLDLSDRKKEGRVEFCTWELEQLTVLEDYLWFLSRCKQLLCSGSAIIWNINLPGVETQMDHI